MNGEVGNAEFEVEGEERGLRWWIKRCHLCCCSAESSERASEARELISPERILGES